jgi:hypothetical protein
MKTKIVTVNVVRYYSKFATIEIEVPAGLVGDDLVEFISDDDDLNDEYEDAIKNAYYEKDDTKFEWVDPLDNNGGSF